MEILSLAGNLVRTFLNLAGIILQKIPTLISEAHYFTHSVYISSYRLTELP